MLMNVLGCFKAKPAIPFKEKRAFSSRQPMRNCLRGGAGFSSFLKKGKSHSPSHLVSGFHKSKLITGDLDFAL